MLGAIIGDVVGSRFEFDENNIKTKTNACFVGIFGIERRRAKNLADGRGKCSCENH